MRNFKYILEFGSEENLTEGLKVEFADGEKMNEYIQLMIKSFKEQSKFLWWHITEEELLDISPLTNSERGTFHWLSTLLGRIRHRADFIADREVAPKIEEIQKSVVELIDYINENAYKIKLK